MTWFLDAGRESLGFSVSIKMDLVFVYVVEKLLDFSVEDRSLINERNFKEVWASNPSQR